MRCPSCERENPESNAFCISCGTDLTPQVPAEEGGGADMRCPSCGRENPESNAFCIHCGTDLTPQPPAEEGPGPDVPSDDATDEVTLVKLQGQVRVLRQEVSEIRAVLALQGIRVRAPAHRQVRREAGWGKPVSAASAASDRTAAPPPPAEPPGPRPWERFQVDWEVILGGNWLARIGVLAVVIGTGFFLKLAFDNNWIGETGRVVLGMTGGLAMLGAGEFWQKRYAAYAQALAGGGVALLYLSIFAAFALYDLIDLFPAVGFLFLISAASAGLAIRYESVTLAIIGIFGAFSAPFILGGSSPGSRGLVQPLDELGAMASGASSVSRAGASSGSGALLLAYIIVVDLGVLALSTFRNWRWLTLLALLGSLAAYGLWYGEYGDSTSLLVSQGSLTIMFLIFVGATTLFHIVWRRAPKAFDHSLMVINVAAYLARIHRCGAALGLEQGVRAVGRDGPRSIPINGAGGGLWLELVAPMAVLGSGAGAGSAGQHAREDNRGPGRCDSVGWLSSLVDVSGAVGAVRQAMAGLAIEPGRE